MQGRFLGDQDACVFGRHRRGFRGSGERSRFVSRWLMTPWPPHVAMARSCVRPAWRSGPAASPARRVAPARETPATPTRRVPRWKDGASAAGTTSDTASCSPQPPARPQSCPQRLRQRLRLTSARWRGSCGCRCARRSRAPADGLAVHRHAGLQLDDFQEVFLAIQQRGRHPQHERITAIANSGLEQIGPRLPCNRLGEDTSPHSQADSTALHGLITDHDPA